MKYEACIYCQCLHNGNNKKYNEKEMDRHLKSHYVDAEQKQNDRLVMVVE